MKDLSEKHCIACEGGVKPASKKEVEEYIKQVPHWKLTDDDREITRTFEFKDFYQTMAFVNAVAWIAHQENHHPDLYVGYNHCRLRYSTHAVVGLTENDFICAAKINAIYDEA